jgi:hypothetical protein
MPAGTLALVALLLGCEPAARQPECEHGRCDLFGQDDRREPFDPDVAPAHRALARSTAAIVFASKLQSDPDRGLVRLQGQSVAEAFADVGMELCPDEPFIDQPSISFCSAFLIAPDRIATARHCVERGIPLGELCSTFRIVFGYARTSNDADPSLVRQDDVYACRDIPVFADVVGDWAVIDLDRAVTAREPLRMRETGELARGDAVGIIGHPLGLPTKLALGEVVFAPSPERTTVFADLDAYQGNSGSLRRDAGPRQSEASGTAHRQLNSIASRRVAPGDGGQATSA